METRRLSRSSFSAASPWPNFTRYPFWNNSAQDFLRLLVLCTACVRVLPLGLRDTKILLGIMAGGKSTLSSPIGLSSGEKALDWIEDGIVTV